MDLWDMTKLLIRRWYFSVPLLLVCVTLVAVASQTVKPDYSAVGHIQLVPPVGTTAANGELVPIKNPWYDLGYQAMGNAAIIDVTKKQVMDQMIADGLTDNITVNMDQVPLFEIEAVGRSPQQATSTVQRVQENIAKAVQARQDGLRVAKADIISTLALDDGSEVTIKRSKIMRVMIVAAGVGLLLTAGITIGLDAMLRARARRRPDGADEETGSEVTETTGPGHGRARPVPGEATQIVVVPPQSGAAGKVPLSNGVPVRSTNIGGKGSSSSSGSRTPGGTEYRSRQTDSNRPEAGADEAPLDATVILSPARMRGESKGESR